ncbi:MAG TPA: CBS domain-containing protein [Terriglobales bacterium]|nr:CBS domain-containing protein [Terriglobales bacterium]
MASVALSEILGSPVTDLSGATVGRVRELALAPQEDRSRLAHVIVKTKEGERLLSFAMIHGVNGGVRAANWAKDWQAPQGTEGFLLLSRDLLDQQVIDVHGRKLVRVNDIDLNETEVDDHVQLSIGAVDVGARGAVRRLLKGLVPAGLLRSLLERIPQKTIPWEFVDLIEIDPARRVRLRISHDRLAKLHPADIADIVEELSPAEREAVFETLDEEVAAGALEEVDPKLQRSIVESLDTDRAADIVEEMDPGAAADLLSDLPEETSEIILEEMEPEPREEVSELLEHEENTAARQMTTQYMALPPAATVHDAIEMMRNFEGGVESVMTIFLLENGEKLVGAVPLPKIVLAKPETRLKELSQEPLVTVHVDKKEKKVAELFDKYNLLTLPVVDDEGRLTGVITADDVISMLRERE